MFTDWFAAHGTGIIFLHPLYHAFEMENMLFTTVQLRNLFAIGCTEVLQADGTLINFAVGIKFLGALFKESFYDLEVFDS